MTIDEAIKWEKEVAKDIREIEHQFIKQNTHYLQILFTEYKIVNKENYYIFI